MQKQMWESNRLLLSQSHKRFSKDVSWSFVECGLSLLQQVSVTSVSMSPESTEILLIDLISLKGSEFGDGSFVIVQPPDRSQFYLAPLRLSQKDDFQKDGNHAIARDCRLLELKLTCNYHHYKIHINLFLAMKLILSCNLDELPAIN